MSGEEIKFLGDLHRLEVKPGDKFVLSLEAACSREMARSLQDTWSRFAGADVPLLVLDRGAKLGVIVGQLDGAS